MGSIATKTPVINSATTFDACLLAQKNGNLTDACQLLEPLVAHAEHQLTTIDNQPILEFSEPFQEKLYLLRTKSIEKMQSSNTAFHLTYYHYGNLLTSLRQYADATRFFERAMSINPVEARTVLSLAKLQQLCGHYDAFLGYTKAAFHLSYRPEDVAQCHENFAEYFMQMRDEEMALACYDMSLLFATSDNCTEKSAALRQKLHHQTSHTLATLSALCHSHDIPLMVDETILSLALLLEATHQQDEDKSTSHYYRQIYARLSAAPH